MLLVATTFASAFMVLPSAHTALASAPAITMHIDHDAALYASMNGMDSADLHQTEFAPVTVSAAVMEDELCELVDTAPSEMHQPMYEEAEESWWVCTGQKLADNCKEIFYDGEMTVACAF